MMKPNGGAQHVDQCIDLRWYHRERNFFTYTHLTSPNPSGDAAVKLGRVPSHHPHEWKVLGVYYSKGMFKEQEVSKLAGECGLEM